MSMQPSEHMADPRHKKPYPTGRKREVTQEWLDQIDVVLAVNKRAGKAPASRAELMEMIGVDKSNMSQLWGTLTKQRVQHSKLVEPISKLLEIEAATSADVPVVLSPRDEQIRRNLIRFRTDANLSPGQVIEMTGIDVTDYERGVRRAGGTELLELAKIYGHAADDFALADPPKGRIEEAPGLFLRTRPGVDIDLDDYNRIQRMIDEANAKMRGRKVKAKGR
jgi:hypothetical protein